MKFLIILLLIINLVFSKDSISTLCGKEYCSFGQTCINSKKCIYQVEEVTIIQEIIDRWTDSNKNPSVKVSVNIVNHSNFVIKDIVMALDAHLNNQQIWGISRCTYNDNLSIINFPQNLNLEPSKIYNFGYINSANNTAHIYIQHLYI